VEVAVAAALERGVNLVDTAINYRGERAERCVGRALARAIAQDQVARDEIIVCTKGGYLPHPNHGAAWFKSEYISNRSFGITDEDLAGTVHCMHPAYLKDQLERSLKNLDLATIDVYYLHNAEAQLHEVKGNVFSHRLRLAFEALEASCAEGKIGCYGFASWNAFRAAPGQAEHLDLAEVKKIATEAAGGKGDHLRFVQLPVNLAMPEALLATQHLDGELVPLLEAARQLHIEVVASGSLCQGQILGAIPPALAAGLGEGLSSAQQALQFTRSTPGLLCALVGMKQPEHVTENLKLCRTKPLEPSAFIAVLGGE
jgi:aryl-alcohol dehydrogenase-like predicted oxidoreductase